jgi:hypothetical protein
MNSNPTKGQKGNVSTISHEAALDMALRIAMRVKRDAEAGNSYAMQVLDEEVFNRK